MGEVGGGLLHGEEQVKEGERKRRKEENFRHLCTYSLGFRNFDEVL